MKTPGSRSGSSSAPGRTHMPAMVPPFRRPSTAVGIAAAGLVVAVVVVSQPALRAPLASSPQWLATALDIVIVSAPLVAAVLLAGLVARGSLGAALGLGSWRWRDAAAGVAIALVARAAVELVAPTTGSLIPPFDVDRVDLVASLVVVVVGGVLVSPIVEELFFRGLALRALTQALSGPVGRAVAATVAVVVTTACFVAIHAPVTGRPVSVALLVGAGAIGLGCGILSSLTDRLGGALVAHVGFNLSGIALLLW